jgi:hypothetical protein
MVNENDCGGCAYLFYSELAKIGIILDIFEVRVSVYKHLCCSDHTYLEDTTLHHYLHSV